MSDLTIRISCNITPKKMTTLMYDAIEHGYLIRWHNMGQHGDYLLMFRNTEDILAFRLRVDLSRLCKNEV